MSEQKLPSSQDFDLAPWAEEQDERAEGVVLIDRFGDGKRTVRAYSPGAWYVVDWELAAWNGDQVWRESFCFTVDQALIDAIAKVPQFQQPSDLSGEPK